MARKVVPIGPFHPLQEEPEFFRLYVEGEKVVDIDIEIGYNHRGIELLSESKTFDQATFLVERICGICSTSHPIAYVNATEDLTGVRPPERALYIRTITGELERIHSHLLWVGLAGHFIGYNTVWMWAWKYREPILDVFERFCGNRNHYAVMKPGGVRIDFPDDVKDFAHKVLDDLEKEMIWLSKAVPDDPVLAARLKDVGILTYEDARAYGAVGPTARASGLEIDVRKDDPYGVYDKVDWDIAVLPNGDVYDKFIVRVVEILESIKIVRQCLLEMPEGELETKIEEYLPGEGIGRHEAPRGEVFHYVRSEGGNNPARHKVRAPSYNNIPTAKVTCVGGHIADAALTLASVDPCYCCTERLVVIDGKRRLNGADLLRLSIERTEELRAKYRGRV